MDRWLHRSNKSNKRDESMNKKNPILIGAVLIIISGLGLTCDFLGFYFSTEPTNILMGILTSSLLCAVIGIAFLLLAILQNQMIVHDKQ